MSIMFLEAFGIVLSIITLASLVVACIVYFFVVPKLEIKCVKEDIHGVVKASISGTGDLEKTKEIFRDRIIPLVVFNHNRKLKVIIEGIEIHFRPFDNHVEPDFVTLMGEEIKPVVSRYALGTGNIKAIFELYEFPIKLPFPLMLPQSTTPVVMVCKEEHVKNAYIGGLFYARNMITILGKKIPARTKIFKIEILTGDVTSYPGKLSLRVNNRST